MDYKKTKKTTAGIATILLLTMIIFTAYSQEEKPQGTNANASGIKKEASRKGSGKSKKPEFFTLNFKDVEIAEFINMMAQMIGKNVVLDETIRGKVTITSAKKIPVADAFTVMKSILELKGLAVVETPNMLKVIPIRDAVKKNTEVIVDGKKVVELESQKTITFLLELQNADAMQISQTLQPLKSQTTDLVVYNALNTIIFSGSSSDIEGLVKIARALDKSPEKDGAVKISKGNIHVIQLKYANAEDLANVLSRVPFSEVAFINNEEPGVRQSAAAQRTAGAPVQNIQQQKTKLSIIASKESNALIITATPNEFVEISRLISELDVVREQVLIEALIVEIDATNSWGFGIDWMIGNNLGSNMIGNSQIFSDSEKLNFKNSTGLDKDIALPLNRGFQLGFLSSRSVLSFALLNASETDTSFNVLSTPQILTIDNQEAELNVGEQIPVQSQSTGSSGTTQYSYDYKSVGVKLKITPHITNDEQITLDLYQEVNQSNGETSLLGGQQLPPTIQKRDIKTKVTVTNGKTIVVGGLISNSKNITESKVPILGDIPLLGWIFKRRTENFVKKNLLVFITPHLVTKPEKLDAITRQKRDEQKMLQKD